MADPEVGKPALPRRETAQRKGTFQWRPFNLFMRLFFFDVDPFIVHGYSTRLEPSDAYQEKTVLTESLYDKFEPAWQAEQLKPQPKLLRAVLAGNVGTLLFTGVLYGIAQATSLAGPLLLQRIVAGIACDAYRNYPGVKCEPHAWLYYYCIGLFLAPAIQSICENHCNYLLYLMGTRMRNTLMAAIYRKCLRLSNSSMQAESQGKVVTLMSNDAQKLQDAAFAIHALWGSPALIIAIIILLWFQVGWATFVGLGVMLLLVPVTGLLAVKLGSFRRELLQWTDKRVGLMSELIAGIQMVKFYAWEVPFQQEVMKYRGQEARILRKQAVWSGVFALSLFLGPVVVAIMCFGSYSVAGNVLTNARAYTALAYFSLLRFPMSFLPMLITMVVNALIAIKRIQGFLVRSEAHMDQSKDVEGMSPGDIKVEGADFVWDDEAKEANLTDINIECKPGTLTMIVGSVGSGKSSVMSAMMGSMTKRKGEVRMAGSIAYVAQTSWIMNDTVQENVLMGNELDADRYRAALKAAQLGPDLVIFPSGDMTEIGDRGITLSGGQKQRISVARAVYHNADIYLLDDPLSAVDSHVGRALFEKCIRGALREKTVVLVTNALQYLPHADNIVMMEAGAIKAQGTYSQLVAQGIEFSEGAHMEEDEDKEDQMTIGAKVAGEEKGGKRGSIENPKFEKSITLKRQDADADRNLTGVEEREQGNLSIKVVAKYIRNAGGWWSFGLLVLLFGCEQALRAYTDRWVGVWFSDRFGYGISPGWFYLGIYAVFGISYGAITFGRSIHFMFMTVRAAVSLHNKLLLHLLRLPKSFFDTNPQGRILNRFSRDTDIMDLTLPGSLIQFAGCIATLIANIIVISIATKWFAIAIPFLIVVYAIIQRLYIPTARELQRIESITRSPIYSKFGEALNGVATIRAYRKEGHFTKVSDVLMEGNAMAYVSMKLAASWLAMRLDALGLLILVGTGVLCIQGNISPSLAGLAILYALDLTRFLKHGTNMASQSEANFNSVERIIQYMEPEPEADPDTSPEVLKELPKDWPQHGAIEVCDLQMRYRPDMPLVLKGISFSCKAGEKVGLVGRTGSGKSSILLALFRMVEPEAGCVRIDGVDTRTLGVRHLRSKMSIIPQDPFLYKGTVRRNLDPLEAYTEAELWEALELVGLKDAITALELKLDHLVVDNGSNFSLGQRQLFCLARAMLRKSRILMLDEATASVDLDSDAKLQMAIRTAFADCTMLTIAHRLNTIMDSDRVVVMENGLVVENGEPNQLLEAHNGTFTGFVEQTGRSASKHLRRLASESSSRRTNSLLKTGQSFAASHPAGPVMSPSFIAAVEPSFVAGKDGTSAPALGDLKGSAPSMLKHRSPTLAGVNEYEAEESEETSRAAASEEVASSSSGEVAGVVATLLPADAAGKEAVTEAAVEEAVATVDEAEVGVELQEEEKEKKVDEEEKGPAEEKKQ